MTNRSIVKRNKNPFNSFMYAQIVNVSPELNELDVEFIDSFGKRKIQIISPFASLNSFRRSMPEIGSYILLGFRSTTTLNPIILQYLSSDEFYKLLKGGQVDSDLKSSFSRELLDTEGVIPYRLLVSGEHEDLSSGQSSSYLSSRGRYELRAGSQLFTLDRDDMEANLTTPEFIVSGLNTDTNVSQDVFKFGVVSRYVNNIRRKKYIEIDGNFAKELYIDLHWKNTPNKLFLLQAGKCIDTAGNEISDEVTSNPIHYRMEVGTNSGKMFGTYIDNTGNFRLNIPDAASTGAIFDLKGDNSSWEVNIGADSTTVVGGSCEYTVEKDSTLNINGSLDETVGLNKTVNINGNLFEKVAGNVNIQATGIIQLKGSLIILN